MFDTYKVTLFSVFISFLILLQSCSQNKKDNHAESHRYSLYLRMENGNEVVVECDSMAQGVIEPDKQGAALHVRDISRDLIVRNHFYYHLALKEGRFIKYQKRGARFESVASLPLKSFSIENFRWLGEDSLQLVGMQSPGFRQAIFAVVNTREMKIVSTGNLPLPPPVSGYSSMSIGFAEPRAEGLLLAYTYHKPVGATSYTTSDTMYTSLLDKTRSRLLSTNKDVRSTYPAGLNTVQSYTFYDEQGDFYFMTCPGIALGNRPDRPTGIFRIKRGESAPDKAYFFNLSASQINNHGYGLWYIGDGKAIVRCERRDLFHDLNDHYSVAQFEFYVVDLHSFHISRLALPLDKGTRRECVLVEGHKVLISINSDTAGNNIWVYDIKTGILNKGARIGGDTDYILRMDKLSE